ncbi:MAG: substrate-binding domain-containing protein [Pseudomonas sp.]|uniref:substrate-binding domain-containing protein n=1 Tax=Pseudomonas sp. TaxID=306 RepID=UPI0027156688|nr:substrate-binding domain-containing protein [Pseudomonas sp.]MDO9619225.1 substrate-binding domain-containing protein [Pseudomonas sp.]MDP2445221.1 substrate-binding domain-containing protein [Pseudomonas sp.]MDZ4333203.1 substrate-binding domain-containing protein [Pseudomonas sp.]
MHRRCQSNYVLLVVVLTSWAAQALAKDCVGVVAAGATPFWGQVEVGARQAAKEYGLDMHFRGPSREGRVETQLQMINWVLEHGCKALVIAPSGLEIVPRVQQLAAHGINTVYFDRDLPGSAVRGVVATDNFRAGVQAGQALAAALGGQGQVALLRLKTGVPSTSERERGFRQGAEQGGLSILVDTYIGDDSQVAVEALREQLPQLAGVFTPNSTSSRAALAALRRLGKAGALLHIGFDADPLLLEALSKGEIHSLMIQQAHAIGYQAVQLAAQSLRGELAAQPVNIALQVQQVSRENLAQWQRAREVELTANP